MCDNVCTLLHKYEVLHKLTQIWVILALLDIACKFYDHQFILTWKNVTNLCEEMKKKKAWLNWGEKKNMHLTVLMCIFVCR